MKQFASFVVKEFTQVLRDGRTLFILLAIPIIQVLVLGYAITTEVNNAEIAVFDPSRDDETQAIKERFAASRYFDIARELTQSADIDAVFRSGDISMVVVFADGFAEGLKDGSGASVQLVADGTDPNRAAILTGYARGVLASWQAERMQTAGVPLRIGVDTHMLYNPQGKSAYNFVPGVLGLVLMLICTMMTSIAIVREKETGSMELLLASPMKPLCIILAKITPYFLLSVVNLLTVLAIAVFVMDVPVRGSLGWLFAASALFIVVALALGLLISSVVNSQMNAMLVSGLGMMMPILFFSGLLFPVESIPDALQWISYIIPARWFIDIARKIMIEGTGVEHFAKELGIIALMAAVLLAVAIKKFKIRLE